MYAKFSNIVQNITQKNRLIATVVLSTHNVCFGWEIMKLFFNYALLTARPPISASFSKKSRT